MRRGDVPAVIFKLIRRLALLAVLLIAVLVAAVILGKPYAERLASRAITEQFGGPKVSVSLETPRAGLLSGDFGDVTVRSEPFQRDKLSLQGARATYRAAHVDLSSVLDRTIRLRYRSVTFEVAATQVAVQAYVREQLRLRGIPGATRARVLFRPQSLLVLSGPFTVRAAIKIAGPASLEIVPLDGGPQIAKALTTTISLGPLPTGVRLRGIRVGGDHVTLTGGGAGGAVTIRR